MARRGGRGIAGQDRRGSSRIPRPLRALIGSAVLIGAVRTADVVWTRVSGRRPPRRDPDTTAQDDAAPSVVRDRLLYALVLDGVLRLARRAGLRDSKDA
jgi:hypothetical protein